MLKGSLISRVTCKYMCLGCRIAEPLLYGLQGVLPHSTVFQGSNCCVARWLAWCKWW